MIAENCQMFFLLKEDTDFKPTDLWENKYEAPSFADKLLCFDQCKNAERYYIRPSAIDFQLRRQSFYTATDSTSSRQDFSSKLANINYGYSAEGEFTIGLSFVSTFFIQYISLSREGAPIFPEIRLVSQEMTFRFLSCMIKGMRFYTGCAGGSQKEFVDTPVVPHDLPTVLTSIRFAAEKAEWSTVIKDKKGGAKNYVKEWQPYKTSLSSK